MTWIPPILVYVRVGWVPLPLPVVLFWPLLAPLLAFALLLAAVLPVKEVDRARRFAAIAQAWRLMGALRGLKLHLQQPGERSLHVVCW